MLCACYFASRVFCIDQYLSVTVEQAEARRAKDKAARARRQERLAARREEHKKE